MGITLLVSRHPGACRDKNLYVSKVFRCIAIFVEGEQCVVHSPPPNNSLFLVAEILADQVTGRVRMWIATSRRRRAFRGGDFCRAVS